MDSRDEINVIEATPQKLTKKDITRAAIRWHAFSETSLNFERLQGLSFCYSMVDILEKLYPNKEELAEALQRHLVLYNTQANWGIAINGITIALEEKVASNPQENEETKTLVTGLKTGLMGPIAGIGDTLDFGTLRPIIIALCVPLAINGSVLAAFIPLIWQVVYMWLVSYKAIHTGYELGSESIVNILESGKIHKVINAAGMFGLLMMGALSASFVKLSTPFVISTQAGEKIVIQEMIDQIVPNLLPILVVFGIYTYITKVGPHFIKILLGIVFISLALSYFGIL